jgi:hypothetical protein
VSEASLALIPTPRGEEPYILSYYIPLDLDVLTPTTPPDHSKDAEERMLVLLDNGEGAGGYEFAKQSNGTYLVQWNTTFAPFGSNTLQVVLYNGITKTCGPTRTEYVTNIVRFDPDETTFGKRGCRFHGFLRVQHADYKIDIYDTRTNLLNTIVGHTDKGVIDENWDLKDSHGNLRDDNEFAAMLEVRPTSGNTNWDGTTNRWITVPCF